MQHQTEYCAVKVLAHDDSRESMRRTYRHPLDEFAPYSRQRRDRNGAWRRRMVPIWRIDRW